MKFSEVLKKLRIEYGLSQAELAKEIGVSRSAIGMYESGERQPDFELFENFADFFNVSMDYLHGLTDNKGRNHVSITCDECGLEYSAKSEEDYQYHQVHHKKWINAKKKFPEIIVSTNRENIKSKAYEIINSKEYTSYEKYNAWIDVFKTYFSGSLSGNDFDLNHINFFEYVSMLLYQDNFKKRITSDIYSKLVSVFGAKRGIPEGKTVYDVTKQVLSFYGEKPSIADVMSFYDRSPEPRKVDFIPDSSPNTQTLLVFNKNGIAGGHEKILPSDEVLNEINKLAQILKAYPAEQIKALYEIVQKGGNIPIRAEMPQDIKELVATVLNLSEENRKALIQVAKSMK